MDVKVLVGLSIAAGAVLAGGIYSVSNAAIQMSAGSGLVAGGVKLLNSFVTSEVGRLAISAGAGAGAALLVPKIDWFVTKLFSRLDVHYFVKREVDQLTPRMKQAWLQACVFNVATPRYNGFSGAPSIIYGTYDADDHVLVRKTEFIKPEHVKYMAPKDVGFDRHIIYDREGKLYSDSNGKVATLDSSYNYNREGSRLTYILGTK